MARYKMTATQRMLQGEQEDRERAKRRAENRREAAIELGEIVLDAGGYVLSAEALSILVRKAVAERDSGGGQPAKEGAPPRSKIVKSAPPVKPVGAPVVREEADELSARAA